MASSDNASSFNMWFLFLETVGRIIEMYLQKVVSPLLRLHDKFYFKLNKVLRAVHDKYDEKIPLWYTANLITYARTTLIVPCLQLLSWGYVWIPSLIVLVVDFGDFLDGVVARYWVDKRPKTEEMKKDEPIPSWVIARRNSTYGGFVDAICDKAFVVPCWIFLLSTVEGGALPNIKQIILWCLILTEVTSGCIRFKAFYTSQGTAPPAVKGLDFSNSAVKADGIGKVKQTFEMVGTSLFMLPYLSVLGVAFLFLAVPLAYESVIRKITKRVIYVQYGNEFNHTTLKFWMLAKSLGSILIVGVPGSTESVEFLNAAASISVDYVIADAPSKVDVPFLRKHSIDYFVTDNTELASESVLSQKMCLVIGDDGTTAKAAVFKAEVERM